MRRKYEYRRRLPHYQSDFKAIFVTFSTYRRWMPEAARTICLDVCLRGDGKRFRLHGMVVMPDHVHLVFNPLSDDNCPFSVAGIMQAIKGSSAHGINASLAHKGRISQEESFDRVLRREENIDDKVGYILENPVRAGLVKIASDYPWLWSKEMRSLASGRTGEDARLSIESGADGVPRNGQNCRRSDCRPRPSNSALTTTAGYR